MTALNIHFLRVSLVLSFCFCVVLRPAWSSEVEPQAILIKGGRVIDGSGGAGVDADVLVRGDRIVSVGADAQQPAAGATVINAKGKVVVPGFIDTHAHGDPYETPDMQNFLAMGVTTICLGQDGSSSRSSELKQWFDDLAGMQLGPNIVTFIGHGTVRKESGIDLHTTATAEHLQQMADLVEQALDEGAYGLTTGLEYQPGTFSNAAELATIAKPVGARGLVVMSHMRSEDDDQLTSSIDELVGQCRGAKAGAHVSHIKSVYGKGAARAEEILKMMERARQSGVRTTADIYPYTASHTGLAILFPTWALPPNKYADVVKSRRDELIAYLRDRVAKRNGPEATLLSTGTLTGKTLAQVAAERGVPYAEVLVELGPRGGSAAYFVMDEELQGRLLRAPEINICSDGSPTMHHPRGYGSFARVIRKFVQEDGALTLEQAVHKMSGLAAKTVGLDKQQRGTIKPGSYADILIFDPTKVKDTATFEKPHQLAEGFDMVLVNGIIVRQNGEFTTKHGGRGLIRENKPAGAGGR